MQAQGTRRDRYARPLAELVFTPWLLTLLACVLGAFLASQFFHVSTRYIKLLIGAAFILTILRLPMHRSLAFFCVVFPVPTFIFLTDSNVLVIGFLLLVWTANVALRRSPRPVRTPLDWALTAYIAVHVASFVNVAEPPALVAGLRNLEFLAAGVVLFVLLVNGIRTGEHLLLLAKALCVTSFLVDVSALVEYFGHGYQILPDWLVYRAGQSVPGGARIGGIFGFHGLLADWSAISFFLQVTLGIRSKRALATTWYFGLAALSLWMIALSVNRGGAVIWMLGGAYYLWLMRGGIRWARLLMVIPVLSAVSLVLELFTGAAVTRLTLFGRIAGTQFQRGIPDTRIKAWTDIMQRIPEHLWIGHGPFYDLRGGKDFGVLWPHSAYLFYLYTVGLVGLGVFVWIVVEVIRRSWPGAHVDFVRDPWSKAAQGVFHVQALLLALAQIRDEHQRGNVYVYVIWIVFALAIAASRIEASRRLLGLDSSPDRATARAPAGRTEQRA